MGDVESTGEGLEDRSEENKAETTDYLSLRDRFPSGLRDVLMEESEVVYKDVAEMAADQAHKLASSVCQRAIEAAGFSVNEVGIHFLASGDWAKTFGSILKRGFRCSSYEVNMQSGIKNIDYWIFEHSPSSGVSHPPSVWEMNEEMKRLGPAGGYVVVDRRKIRELGEEKESSIGVIATCRAKILQENLLRREDGHFYADSELAISLGGVNDRAIADMRFFYERRGEPSRKFRDSWNRKREIADEVWEEIQDFTDGQKAVYVAYRFAESLGYGCMDAKGEKDAV